MKATGMVRRVDSLGRIVIPKEIRKVLKIKENEQVEINVQDDSIVLNRYSDLDEYDISLNNLIKCIEDVYDKHFILTNLNKIVLTSNKYKEYQGLELSPYLNNVLDERKDVSEYIPIFLSINRDSDDIKVSYVIKTVIKNGDTVGLLMLLSDTNLENSDLKLLDLMNNFLDKYLD